MYSGPLTDKQKELLKLPIDAFCKLFRQKFEELADKYSKENEERHRLYAGLRNTIPLADNWEEELNNLTEVCLKLLYFELVKPPFKPLKSYDRTVIIKASCLLLCLHGFDRTVYKHTLISKVQEDIYFMSDASMVAEAINYLTTGLSEGDTFDSNHATYEEVASYLDETNFLSYTHDNIFVYGNDEEDPILILLDEKNIKKGYKQSTKQN
jgi:hypothetical protein